MYQAYHRLKINLKVKSNNFVNEKKIIKPDPNTNKSIFNNNMNINNKLSNNDMFIYK